MFKFTVSIHDGKGNRQILDGLKSSFMPAHNEALEQAKQLKSPSYAVVDQYEIVDSNMIHVKEYESYIARGDDPKKVHELAFDDWFNEQNFANMSSYEIAWAAWEEAAVRMA